MDKAFFKIVVPNYNSIAYLAKCLDSVLCQTFQDFVVVLVDDGSDDFSYELARSYERRRPDKVRVLRAEGKRYAGGCRNVGMDYPLDCEYICFMDADDYLYSPGSLAAVARGAESRPDVLLFGWATDTGGVVRHQSFQDFSKYRRRLAQSPWNAAWSRAVRPAAAERFLEGCMRGEDTYQMLRIMDRSPRVEQIRDVVYVYRQVPTSAVHSPVFQQHRPVFVDALRRLRAEARSQDVVASIDRRLGL